MECSLVAPVSQSIWPVSTPYNLLHLTVDGLTTHPGPEEAGKEDTGLGPGLRPQGSQQLCHQPLYNLVTTSETHQVQLTQDHAVRKHVLGQTARRKAHQTLYM